MSHVRTSPHELEGNFNFFEHGLGPYWAISKLLFVGFDGDSGEIDAEIGGERHQQLVQNCAAEIDDRLIS